MKHQHVIEFDVPDGYEWTGEYSYPYYGDIYLCNGRVLTNSLGHKTLGKYPILQKIPQAPETVPNLHAYQDRPAVDYTNTLRRFTVADVVFICACVTMAVLGVVGGLSLLLKEWN